MKTKFILLLILFFCNVCCSQPLNDVATELKEAIKSKDLYVVTVTRPKGNNSPFLPIELFVLFEDIQKMLKCRSCTNNDTWLSRLSAFNRKIWSNADDKEKSKITGYYSEIKNKIAVENEDLFCKKVGEIRLPTVKNSLKDMRCNGFKNDRYVILVFQECFFSKTHALDNEYVNLICNYCVAITNKNKKIIIFVNFLHEFEQGAELEYLKNYKYPDYLLAFSSDSINFMSPNRLANYSLVFYDGYPIALYRKGFYEKEKDDLIRRGYSYEFGNFKMKKVDENHEEIKQTIELLRGVTDNKNENKIDKLRSALACLNNILMVDFGINKAKEVLSSEIGKGKNRYVAACGALECLNYRNVASNNRSQVYDVLFSVESPLCKMFICADMNASRLVGQCNEVNRLNKDEKYAHYAHMITKEVATIENINFLNSMLYVIQSNFLIVHPWIYYDFIPINRLIIKADPGYSFVGTAMKKRFFRTLYGSCNDPIKEQKQEKVFDYSKNGYIINIYDL